MKKIAYLVAPLMVMPFLIGCNKVKTHKVQSVLSTGQSLKFTTMKGKELKGSAFNHKQNFKFKVETADEAGLTVDPHGIGIYIGKDAATPLLDGYTIEYTKENKTAATVTVLADKVTDDIYIDGIAAKVGNYIYSVPVMLGVRMPEGEKTLNWAPIGDSLNLEFEGVGEESNPDEDCFLYTDDAENFYYKDETAESWYKKHITFGAGAEGRVKVTVNANSMKDGTGYLLIAARSGSKGSFLNAFKWDEIGEISRNGYAPYLFRLGEEKEVSFKTTGENEVKHIVRIIGFDHDADKDGNVAGITFQFKTVISDAAGVGLHTMWNSGEGYARDFGTSSLNRVIKETVLPLLPEDLRNNMVTVSKKYGQYNETEYTWPIATIDTQLFPLSAKEVSEKPRTQGSSDITVYYPADEGVTYEYFKGDDTHNERKAISADGTTPCGYWLRSPNTYQTAYANFIASTGYFTANHGASITSTNYGVAPAFCI